MNLSGSHAEYTTNPINVFEAEELKLYTIYSPPHNQDGIVRATKKDAESISEDFDGKTTE